MAEVYGPELLARLARPGFEAPPAAPSAAALRVAGRGGATPWRVEVFIS